MAHIRSSSCKSWVLEVQINWSCSIVHPHPCSPQELGSSPHVQRARKSLSFSLPIDNLNLALRMPWTVMCASARVRGRRHQELALGQPRKHKDFKLSLPSTLAPISTYVRAYAPTSHTKTHKNTLETSRTYSRAYALTSDAKARKIEQFNIKLLIVASDMESLNFGVFIWPHGALTFLFDCLRF